MYMWMHVGVCVDRKATRLLHAMGETRLVVRAGRAGHGQDECLLVV